MKILKFAFLAGFLAMAPFSEAKISDAIRVNSIGFHPEYSKGATVIGGGSTFQVVQAGNESEVVFEGELSKPFENEDTGETVREADFSELQTVGVYVVKVEGLGSSAAFSINHRAYLASLELHMLGFYGQRCGQAVRLEHQGETYTHPACHTADAYLDYVGTKGRKDATGGWHDAGDYNKYTLNSAAAMAPMFAAWDRYPQLMESLSPHFAKTDEKLPAFLDEMKWQTQWMLKMQFADGTVSHKLSARKFDRFEMPHKEREPQYFSDWGTSATAAFAGTMAMASRAFEKADPALGSRCLAAAREAWKVLETHPENRRPDISKFSTGGYQAEDPQQRIFAAGELFRTTGEQKYADAFKALVEKHEQKVEKDWDWGGLANLGFFAYLAAGEEKGGKALYAEIKKQAIKAADKLVAIRNVHGYRRALTKYRWGSNGSLARTSMLLDVAWSLTKDKKYLETMQDQASYIYGRNYYNRSQVTGEGYRPPLHPHHRPSGSDGIDDPWPGLLVGGGWPDGKGWEDKEGNYRKNETAINWSGAMVYLLAALSGEH